MKPFIALGVALVALGVATSAMTDVPQRDQPVLRRADDAPYPDSWRTTLEQAVGNVEFTIFVPDTSEASEATLMAVFLYPGGQAVALDFPPQPVDSPVRQDYIEVWESAWAEGDPKTFLEESASVNPESKQLITIDGVLVLSVSAHSTADAERANPSLVRFELEGTDVQVSGGDNTETLLGIAKSIIDQRGS